MRILVFGAGSIGSVLGGLLAGSGHDVTLLGRPWHLDVVEREGLRISGFWGEHRIAAHSGKLKHASGGAKCLTTATNIEQLEDAKSFDWIFVCVKAHQTWRAASSLSSVLGPRTLVCSFQNGLGNYEALIKCIEPSRVALARIIFGVELKPGHAHVSVCADEVLIGAVDNRFPIDQALNLASALKASGIPASYTGTIVSAIWSKVLYNCALNGLSMLLELPYGKLLEQPLSLRIMRSIIEEAYSVAVSHNVQLAPSTAPEYCKLLFERLIPDTAAHHSSMLQDLCRNRPTEIDALNGAIVRLGKAYGIKTPVNELISQLVHSKERFAGVGYDQVSDQPSSDQAPAPPSQ